MARSPAADHTTFSSSASFGERLGSPFSANIARHPEHDTQSRQSRQPPRVMWEIPQNERVDGVRDLSTVFREGRELDELILSVLRPTNPRLSGPERSHPSFPNSVVPSPERESRRDYDLERATHALHLAVRTPSPDTTRLPDIPRRHSDQPRRHSYHPYLPPVRRPETSYESVNPPDSQGNPGSRPGHITRTTTACERCRIKKTRCSAGPPLVPGGPLTKCVSCTNKDEECVYTCTQKKRGPQAGSHRPNTGISTGTVDSQTRTTIDRGGQRNRRGSAPKTRNTPRRGSLALPSLPTVPASPASQPMSRDPSNETRDGGYSSARSSFQIITPDDDRRASYEFGNPTRYPPHSQAHVQPLSAPVQAPLASSWPRPPYLPHQQQSPTPASRRASSTHVRGEPQPWPAPPSEHATGREYHPDPIMTARASQYHGSSSMESASFSDHIFDPGYNLVSRPQLPPIRMLCLPKDVTRTRPPSPPHLPDKAGFSGFGWRTLPPLSAGRKVRIVDRRDR